MDRASDETKKTPSAASAHLDRRYGKIGISAVAAALRFRGQTKNPAYAPVNSRPDERYFGQAVA